MKRTKSAALPNWFWSRANSGGAHTIAATTQPPSSHLEESVDALRADHQQRASEKMRTLVAAGRYETCVCVTKACSNTSAMSQRVEPAHTAPATTRNNPNGST